MRINHNMSALKANRQLNRTENNLDRSIERLSSGYKINRSSDDPAGMSISRKMMTQIEGLEQASRNASDGISVIQTAEGALNEVNAMLQRMRELAVQASNETYTEKDRIAIQDEIDQLSSEIERISTDTEFNTKTLLDGTVERKTYTNVNGVDFITVADTIGKGQYTINVTGDAHQAVLVGKAGDVAYFGDGITVGGRISINGAEINVKVGDSSEEIFAKIQEACECAGINVGAYSSGPALNEDNLEWAGYELDYMAEGSALVFVSKEYGSKASIDIACSNPELCDALGITSSAHVEGVDPSIELGEEFEKTATISYDGQYATITDRDGFEMVVRVEGIIAETGFIDATVDSAFSYSDGSVSGGGPVECKATVLDVGDMVLQIGANTYQTLDVNIPRMDMETLGLKGLNLRTSQNAEKAITMIDNAIRTTTNTRSKLGAYQNRLEHSILNLDESSEDMTSALSRISDVDMAKEMTRYTQYSVLSQAGTSVLAQANERPQTVLTLLQG